MPFTRSKCPTFLSWLKRWDQESPGCFHQGERDPWLWEWLLYLHLGLGIQSQPGDHQENCRGHWNRLHIPDSHSGCPLSPRLQCRVRKHLSFKNITYLVIMEVFYLFISPYKNWSYLLIPLLWAQPFGKLQQALAGRWSCRWPAVRLWIALLHAADVLAETSDLVWTHDRLLDQLCQDGVWIQHKICLQTWK